MMDCFASLELVARRTYGRYLVRTWRHCSASFVNMLLILNRGANVNELEKDAHSWTPLHPASTLQAHENSSIAELKRRLRMICAGHRYTWHRKEDLGKLFNCCLNVAYT